MPKLKVYADLTREKRNTLSKESQRVVSKLDGGLTITTYVNELEEDATRVQPNTYKSDVARYAQYTRFKPEIKLNYVYYYKLVPGGDYANYYKGLTEQQVFDTVNKIMEFNYKIHPYKDIASTIDLSAENYHMVTLIERENGKKTFLRFFNDGLVFPEEKEISAALKRLAEPLPVVGFVTGHNERTCNSENDRGYSLFANDKSLRSSLINNGFDFETITLMAPVPDNIDILVIADARKPFNDTELKNYRDYLAKGGNLFIAGDPEKQAVMNSIGEPVGVSFMPGKLAHAKPNMMQDVIAMNAVNTTNWIGKPFENLKNSPAKVIMNGACGIKHDPSKGFNSLPLLVSDSSNVWSELETTDVVEDTAVFNPVAGEVKQPYTGALALERKVNGKEQKVMVTGDADWISNLEIVTARKNIPPANFYFVELAFYWLSNYAVPIDTTRDEPIDNKIDVTQHSFALYSVLFKWGIPLLLLATGLFIWIRRKGR
ncbi:MAG: GldG family protein [Chitinophagaceae bacterium]|nr:GldG family protein [Chitinophagaceae bacterium]